MVATKRKVFLILFFVGDLVRTTDGFFFLTLFGLFNDQEVDEEEEKRLQLLDVFADVDLSLFMEYPKLNLEVIAQLVDKEVMKFI